MKIKKMMTILFLNSLLFSVCSLFGMQEQGSLSVEVKDVLNLVPSEIYVAYLKLLSSTEFTEFKQGIKVVAEHEFESVNPFDLFVEFEEIRQSETKKYELNENDVDNFLFYLNQMPVFQEKIDFTKKFTYESKVIESIEKKDKDLASFIEYINKKCKLDENDCEESPMIIFDIKSENKLIQKNLDDVILEEEGEDEEEEGKDEGEELEKKIKSNRLVHQNLYIQSYLKNEKVQTHEQKEVCCKKMIHYWQEKLENLKQFHEVGIPDLYWKGYQSWKNNYIKNNSEETMISTGVSFVFSGLKCGYDAFKKQETFKEKYGELLFETIHPEKDLENYEEGGEPTTKIQVDESSTVEILDITLEQKFEALNAEEKVEQFSDFREQLKKDFDVEIEKCKKAMKKLAEQYEKKRKEKLEQKKQKEELEKEAKEREVEKRNVLDKSEVINWDRVENVYALNQWLCYSEELDDSALEKNLQCCIDIFFPADKKENEGEERREENVEEKLEATEEKFYSCINFDNELTTSFLSNCLGKKNKDDQNSLITFFKSRIEILQFDRKDLIQKIIEKCISSHAFLNCIGIKDKVYYLLYLQYIACCESFDKESPKQEACCEACRFANNVKRLSKDEQKEFFEFVDNRFTLFSKCNVFFKYGYLYSGFYKLINEDFFHEKMKADEAKGEYEKLCEEKYKIFATELPIVKKHYFYNLFYFSKLQNEQENIITNMVKDSQFKQDFIFYIKQFFSNCTQNVLRGNSSNKWGFQLEALGKMYTCIDKMGDLDIKKEFYNFFCLFLEQCLLQILEKKLSTDFLNQFSEFMNNNVKTFVREEKPEGDSNGKDEYCMRNLSYYYYYLVISYIDNNKDLKEKNDALIAVYANRILDSQVLSCGEKTKTILINLINEFLEAMLDYFKIETVVEIKNPSQSNIMPKNNQFSFIEIKILKDIYACVEKSKKDDIEKKFKECIVELLGKCLSYLVEEKLLYGYFLKLSGWLSTNKLDCIPALHKLVYGAIPAERKNQIGLLIQLIKLFYNNNFPTKKIFNNDDYQIISILANTILTNKEFELKEETKNVLLRLIRENIENDIKNITSKKQIAESQSNIEPILVNKNNDILKQLDEIKNTYLKSQEVNILKEIEQLSQGSGNFSQFNEEIGDSNINSSKEKEEITEQAENEFGCSVISDESRIAKNLEEFRKMTTKKGCGLALLFQLGIIGSIFPALIGLKQLEKKLFVWQFKNSFPKIYEFLYRHNHIFLFVTGLLLFCFLGKRFFRGWHNKKIEELDREILKTKYVDAGLRLEANKLVYISIKKRAGKLWEALLGKYPEQEKSSAFFAGDSAAQSRVVEVNGSCDIYSFVNTELKAALKEDKMTNKTVEMVKVVFHEKKGKECDWPGFTRCLNEALRGGLVLSEQPMEREK